MKKLFFFFSIFYFLFPSPTSAQHAWNMTKLFQWEHPTEVMRYNDVWGWHNPQTGQEFGILGSVEYLFFFDLTDKSNIYLIDSVRTDGFALHVDFKNKDQYLYLATGTQNGTLKIIDLSTLPDSVSVVYNSGDVVTSAHNIWIEGDRLYVCLPTPRLNQQTYYGLEIYDISDPLDPQFLIGYGIQTQDWVPYVHDMYSRGDTVYLHSEGAGFFIVDLRDIHNTQLLGSFTNYPYSGYNHSGWLSEDGKQYIMADENRGSPLKLLDVGDFSDIQLASFLSPEMLFPVQDTLAMPHNPMIHDGHVYASYNKDGIYIWDIQDPKKPVVQAFYHTYTDSSLRGFVGAWGVYSFLPSGLILGSDKKNGFFVLEPDLTGSPLNIDSKNESFEFSISPNPATTWIHIQSQILRETVNLSLFNVQGKLIQEISWKHFTQAKWKLKPGLPTGLYFLHLTSEDRRTSQKIWIKGQ